VPSAHLAAVVFTHLHQDHCRGATWSGELTFPGATGFAHAAEVAFWSGPEAAGGTADEHRAAAMQPFVAPVDAFHARHGEAYRWEPLRPEDQAGARFGAPFPAGA